MHRSPDLEETPSSPDKCTQIGNELSENRMTEDQERQSMAAATGAAKPIPRSGFLIVSSYRASKQHLQLSRANNEPSAYCV